MPNKTIQIYGAAYGTDPAETVVQFNGNVVFSGQVPTLDKPVPAQPGPDDDYLLCSFEIPLEYEGSAPASYAVSGSAICFGDMKVNYAATYNTAVYSQEEIGILTDPNETLVVKVPIYSAHAVPPFTQAELDILYDAAVPVPEKEAIQEAHGCAVIYRDPNTYQSVDSDDPRENVVIDGVAQNPDRTGYPPAATWWWTVSPGSTMTFTMSVGQYNNSSAVMPG